MKQYLTDKQNGWSLSGDGRSREVVALRESRERVHCSWERRKVTKVLKVRKNTNHHFCFGWILTQQESRNNSNVPARITCIPHSITEERHLITDFYVKPVETIQSCQEVTSGCQRFPRMYTYYPHTTFNRTIDVGVCAGSCGNQLSDISLTMYINQ